MIIFCFLTYEDIVPINLWNNFFNNINPEKYSVFIHPKYKINPQLYNFKVHQIKNKILTISKSHISIVQATLQLLRESYYKCTNGSHFIFLTQHCIPLYSFNVYEQILMNSNKSIISYINHNSKERYYQMDRRLHNYINYNQFIKQQPNMILIKQDVYDFITHDFTSYFKNMMCPDEHYFINMLLYIFKKDIIRQQTHFCNYNLRHTQALNFNQLNINKYLIDNIRKRGFLFMRKITFNNFSQEFIKYLLA